MPAQNDASHLTIRWTIMWRETLSVEEPQGGHTPSKGGLPIADNIIQLYVARCYAPPKKHWEKQDGNPLFLRTTY